jgi:hypothetical protein
MKETPRPDPLAAAHRVKDMARDLAQDVADGYRKSTRYFKLRAAVIGAWALLATVTLWAACPSSGPSNSLGAVVTYSDQDPTNHQISVENRSDELWRDVVLTLDGGWEYRTTTIRNGERAVVIAIRQFRKDGAPAAGDLTPRTITISCREGEVTTPLSFK